jgi:hypothetical protein
VFLTARRRPSLDYLLDRAHEAAAERSETIRLTPDTAELLDASGETHRLRRR